MPRTAAERFHSSRAREYAKLGLRSALHRHNLDLVAKYKVRQFLAVPLLGTSGVVLGRSGDPDERCLATGPSRMTRLRLGMPPPALPLLLLTMTVTTSTVKLDRSLRLTVVWPEHA